MDREAGSAATEYVLLLVVVAALVVVVPTTALGEHTVSLLRAGLCRLTGTACPGDDTPLTDEDVRPALCQVSHEAVRGGVDVSVGLVDAAAGMTVARADRSDGTVAFTVIDDGRVGVAAGVGAEAGLGAVSLDVAARGRVGLTGRSGDTWIVPAGEADEFERRLVRGEPLRRTAERLPGVPSGVAGWVTDRAFGALDEPDLTFAAAGVRVDLEARSSLSLAARRLAQAAAGGSAALLLGTEVDRRPDDPADWTVTTSLEADLVLRGHGGTTVGRLGATHGLTTVVKETRGKDDGELVQVELVTTTTTTDLARVGAELPEVTARLGSEGSRTVVETVTIPLDTPADRVLAEGWLTTLDPARSPGLVDLAHRRGRMSLTVHDGDGGSVALGGRLAVGGRLGGLGVATTNRRSLLEAYYLAAPGASGRRDLVPFTDCLDAIGR